MSGLFAWCVKCGRPLLDKESQRRGMGPGCASMPEAKKVLEMIERIRQPELMDERREGHGKTKND